MRVGSAGGAKVLSRLAVRLAALQQQRSLTERVTQGVLVQGQALATGGEDPRTRGVREAEGAHAQLGHVQHPHIIGDRADDDRGLASIPLPRDELCHRLDRDGRLVRLRGEETLQDSLVEFRVRAARKEAIELH